MKDTTAHIQQEGGGASRSTDPAAGTSSATDVSLREYVSALVQALDRHLTSELQALRRETQTANEKSDKATELAKHEASDRLAAHNGLIDQMQKLQGTFATREAVAALEKHLTEKIDTGDENADLRFGKIERFQATLVGGLMIVGFIGVANLVKVWTG